MFLGALPIFPDSNQARDNQYIDGVFFYYKDPNPFNLSLEVMPQSIQFFQDIRMYSLSPTLGLPFTFVSAFDEKNNASPTVLSGNVVRSIHRRKDDTPEITGNLFFRSGDKNWPITITKMHKKLSSEFELFMESKKRMTCFFIPQMLPGDKQPRTICWKSMDKSSRRGDAVRLGVHLAESWLGGLLQLQFELSTVGAYILEVVAPEGGNYEAIEEVLQSLDGEKMEISESYNMEDTFWMYWPLSKPHSLSHFIKQLCEMHNFTLPFLQSFWTECHPENSGFYCVKATERKGDTVCLFWMYPLSTPEYEIVTEAGVSFSYKDGKFEKGLCLLECQCPVLIASAGDNTNAWTEYNMCTQKSQFFVSNVTTSTPWEKLLQFDGLKIIRDPHKRSEIQKSANLWESPNNWGLLERMKKTGNINAQLLKMAFFDRKIHEKLGLKTQDAGSSEK